MVYNWHCWLYYRAISAIISCKRYMYLWPASISLFQVPIRSQPFHRQPLPQRFMLSTFVVRPALISLNNDYSDKTCGYFIILFK